MTSNLYEEHPLMIDSGTFWRCRHGKTGAYAPCAKCGIFHPIRFVRDWYDWMARGKSTPPHPPSSAVDKRE